MVYKYTIPRVWLSLFYDSRLSNSQVVFALCATAKSNNQLKILLIFMNQNDRMRENFLESVVVLLHSPHQKICQPGL